MNRECIAILEAKAYWINLNFDVLTTSIFPHLCPNNIPMARLDTPPQKQPQEEFPFERKNFIILLIGIAVLIIGFALMAGGGSPNPNEFSMEIFSKRRITVAPILVLIGFGIMGYSIMYKPKKTGAGATEESLPYKKK